MLEYSEIVLEFLVFDQNVELYRRHMMQRILPFFILTVSPPVSVLFLWKMKIPQESLVLIL